MKIIANGQSYELPDGQALPAFLEGRGLVPARVAVERNGAAMTPAEVRTTVLADGDRLEIVRVVAGG